MKTTKLRAIAIGVATLLIAAASRQAQANPFERGPAPTTASLEAAAGPFAVGSNAPAAPVGYKAATVYYPTTGTGPFGVVAFAPGFIETQSWNVWWAKYLASHGFVVINMDTKSTLEGPADRRDEQLAALKDVIKRSQTMGSPFYGKIDPTRQGVMGHSYGGASSLLLARDYAYLKAAIPMAAKSPSTKDFSNVAVPTLVIACKGDIVSNNGANSEAIYKSLSPSLDKAYMELEGGGGHPCTTSLGTSAQVKTTAAKYGVSWLKRFMDDDTRYSQFLCGAPHKADLAVAGSKISIYKDNCPY